MILSRLQAAQLFDIWQPRWRDRAVLLADFKIGQHNEIRFPKTPSMPGNYYISGEKAKTFPLEAMKTKAGKTIQVRAIPLDELEPLERQ